jgi:hypothetical protein
MLAARTTGSTGLFSTFLTYARPLTAGGARTFLSMQFGQAYVGGQAFLTSIGTSLVHSGLVLGALEVGIGLGSLGTGIGECL